MNILLNIDDELLIKAGEMKGKMSRKAYLEMLLEAAVKVAINNISENKERILTERNMIIDRSNYNAAMPYTPLQAGRNLTEAEIQSNMQNGGVKPVDMSHPYERTAVQMQIEAIRAEKIPPERNTSLGRRAWENEQRERIALLGGLSIE